MWRWQGLPNLLDPNHHAIYTMNTSTPKLWRWKRLGHSLPKNLIMVWWFDHLTAMETNGRIYQGGTDGDLSLPVFGSAGFGFVLSSHLLYVFAFVCICPVISSAHVISNCPVTKAQKGTDGDELETSDEKRQAKKGEEKALLKMEAFCWGRQQ